MSIPFQIRRLLQFPEAISNAHDGFADFYGYAEEGADEEEFMTGEEIILYKDTDGDRNAFRLHKGQLQFRFKSWEPVMELQAEGRILHVNSWTTEVPLGEESVVSRVLSLHRAGRSMEPDESSRASSSAAHPGDFFLPDQDPQIPQKQDHGRVCDSCYPPRHATQTNGVQGGLGGQSRWLDATESSLALVRSMIVEKRAMLESASADKADLIRHEVHLLKLQQARLAGALWQHEADGGVTASDCKLKQLEAAARKGKRFNPAVAVAGA